MAFTDKLELNIQNDHSGIYDILQVAPSPYRSGAGFRKMKELIKAIDRFKITHFVLPLC